MTEAVVGNPPGRVKQDVAQAMPHRLKIQTTEA
jgi:hypothetical protein